MSAMPRRRSVASVGTPSADHPMSARRRPPLESRRRRRHRSYAGRTKEGQAYLCQAALPSATGVLVRLDIGERPGRATRHAGRPPVAVIAEVDLPFDRVPSRPSERADPHADAAVGARLPVDADQAAGRILPDRRRRAAEQANRLRAVLTDHGYGHSCALTVDDADSGPRRVAGARLGQRTDLGTDHAARAQVRLDKDLLAQGSIPSCPDELLRCERCSHHVAIVSTAMPSRSWFRRMSSRLFDTLITQ